MAEQRREERAAREQPLPSRVADEELSQRLISYFLTEAWNKRDLAVVDQLFASDAVGHDPAVPAVTDRETIKQFIAAYLTAFPDLQITVDDLFAAADKVATRWTMRGTHKGEFLGIAPTEKTAVITGVTIYRLTNEKIAEYWAYWDSPGLVQQLGAARQEEPAKGA